MSSETQQSKPLKLSSTRFEEIEHTADWALKVRGHDLSDLLINAAQGMNHLLVEDPTLIPLEREVRFDLEACDAEALLVGWLNDLAYWAEMEQVIFIEFDLQEVTPTHLQGRLRFQAVGRGGHAPQLQKHIKAVTYHNLAIIETENGLEVTIVFDV